MLNDNRHVRLIVSVGKMLRSFSSIAIHPKDTRETGCVEATVPKSISVSEMTNSNNGGVRRGISFASRVQTVVINGETASARATKNTTLPTSFSNRSRITFFLLFVNILLHQEDSGQKGDVHPALLDGKRFLQDAGVHLPEGLRAHLPLSALLRREPAGAGGPRRHRGNGVRRDVAFRWLKKTGFGSSKPLTVAHGEPWPGCSAVVILRLSGGSTRNSGT